MRVGLTGGIGSGKSTVARMFAERGAVIVDADQIARDIVEPGGLALQALVAEFGSGILQPNGTLSRGELARIAFSDPDATARLNAIMHPLIRAESERQLSAQPDSTIVVYDMPLLVESGQDAVVDVVVVVDVPEEIQLDRAIDLRGLDEEDVRRRMSLQASREERLAAADFVIDNSSDLVLTALQVDDVWDRISNRLSDGSLTVDE